MIITTPGIPGPISDHFACENNVIVKRTRDQLIPGLVKRVQLGTSEAGPGISRYGDTTP